MKRDLEQYLVSLQKQYTGMLKAVDEANELIKEGKMTSGQAEQIKKYMDTINTNYQRVLYCRYLLNLPPKFIQKIQKKKLEKEQLKFIEKNNDSESVVNESQEALDGIEEIVDVSGKVDGE